jgi:hypothetical protein
MLRKQYIISLLVALLSLGFAGSVMAGENDYNTILGSDEFTFESSESKNVTASNHVYDQEKLALIGTEAGDWQYDFSANAKQTQSEKVASDRDSDQSHLSSSVGTEAGDWEYSFDSPGNAVCGSC